MQNDQVVLDLRVRTTFQDAQVARRQIEKGKAEGRLGAVRFRAWNQKQFFRLGAAIHRKTQLCFFPLLLGLGVLLAGYKMFYQNSEFNELWVESGGRLETELRYSASALGEAGSVVHLLIAQTAKQGTSRRLLHQKSLLSHLQVLKIATRVSVNLYDVSWNLKDICLSPSAPDFENHWIDNIFENMMPCEIITPLDCFWEGSKLLGPDHPITIPFLGNGVKWTNLNPQNLTKTMKSAPPETTVHFPFDMLDNYMKRAGITSGYQEKQCLDPEDPECPETAPNKKSKKIPDIGAELTNGCRGFASKFMHWPRDLMLGGLTFNKSGYVQDAGALQSVIQLMGEKELYENWAQNFKVLHFSWDQEKAALVLKAWQKKFNEEVHKLLKNNSTMDPYNFYTFSTMLLNDLLSQYDFLDHKLLYAGGLLLTIYIVIAKINIFDAVRSQLTISLFSLALILWSIASGIGLCSLIGIQIHTATILMSIAISAAIGIHNMYLLMSCYKIVSTHCFDLANLKYVGIMGKKQVGMVLKSAGIPILMENLIAVSIFLTAAVVPIPALRAFCLQVAILVMFVMVTSILGITSLISIDVRRKRTSRIDVFCCFPTEDKLWPLFNNINCMKSASTIDSQMRQFNGKLNSSSPTSSNVSFKEFVDLGSDSEDVPITKKKKRFWKLNSKDISQKYVKCLTVSSRKCVLLSLILVLAGSGFGTTRIQAGLTLPEMVPSGTNEQKFLDVYSQMFGFYNLYAVTRGDFEYPTNQKLLYEYHDAFMRVPNILKNDNGGLPQMWLTLFKDWLIGLQKAFDKDWSKNCINQEGWLQCATENGILGYKLLVQTGNNDNPIDKTLVSTARLVDDSGIINEETFYNLLTAWASNDILAYGASQANIRPEPRRWTHVAVDFDLQIVKSSPITYAQMPYYASHLYETSVITKFITTVRGICKQYDERGLPNYPSGIPFLYWEQYQDLCQYSLVALLCAFVLLFVVSGIFLCNVRAAFLVVFMAAIQVFQTLGFMGFADIKFSAIPVVLLIGTIGTGAPFIVRLCLSFVTCIGDKHRRTYLSVDHMSKLILQSAVTMVIAVFLLFFQNNYVSKSYFLMIVANTVFSLYNGLVCLPVFLSMFGPPPEIKPFKYADRISTPSPEPLRKRLRHTSVRQSVTPNSPISRSHHKQQNHRKQKLHRQRSKNNLSNHRVLKEYILSDPLLSTISEESGSCNSASIVNMGKSQTSSRSSSPSIQAYNSTDSESEIDIPLRSPSVSSGSQHSIHSTHSAPTTRCVLTAKFELELEGNVMSAASQPCVHQSSSKVHHNNRQPKRRKRRHSNRY